MRHRLLDERRRRARVEVHRRRLRASARLQRGAAVSGGGVGGELLRGVDAPLRERVDLADDALLERPQGVRLPSRALEL